MNPILNLLQGNQNNILMQAVGAMMRGENPTQFMQKLAQEHPQLQGLDLTNLNKTAEDLCAKNGQDINDIKGKINQFISNMK